ncbi:MAG: peroxisome assembly protein (Peroxin-2) [Bathelium mastoideum]|nr:MAG: peroxisome assembly protein (Peroxin-2) [Bathelium mastoideum]
MTSADFALAQQRLAARRRQRAIDCQSRIPAHASILNDTVAHLPHGLQIPGKSLLSAWDKIKTREGTRPAFRVGQLDSELLDEELLSLLQGQVGEALKYYGAHLRDEWSPEVLFALRTILFKLTIWDHNASYGAVLQGLRYTDARQPSLARRMPTAWQKSIYFIVSTGGRYGWTKWENWLLDREASYDEPTPNVRYLTRITSLATTAHSLAAFVSFLVFLLNGKYRTLLDRLLRLRLAPISSQVSREVSFEYLNRQLVWHAFTEFLLFILPLVGISRWRRWLVRAWRKAKATFRSSSTIEEGENWTARGQFQFLPERTCAICYQDQNPVGATGESEMMTTFGAPSGIVGSAQTDITNPYETRPCGCIYCYVCIAQKLEAEEDEGWTCLKCGALVKECRPWTGDVLEGVSRPSSGKSVGFITEKSLQDMDPMPESNTGSVDKAVEHDTSYVESRSLEPPGVWASLGGSAPSESVTPCGTDEQASASELCSETDTQEDEI